MDLKVFINVVQFILKSFYDKDYLSTPKAETVTSVRTYNMKRAFKAKKLADHIKNSEFISDLRSASGIIQLNKIPDQCQCIISNEKLKVDNGKIIITKNKDIHTPYIIHQRFLTIIHHFFVSCIMMKKFIGNINYGVEHTKYQKIFKTFLILSPTMINQT